MFLPSQDEYLFKDRIYNKNDPVIIEHEKRRERIKNKTSTLNDRISFYCDEYHEECIGCIILTYLLFLLIVSFIFNSIIIFMGGIMLIPISIVLFLMIISIKYIII